MASTELELKLRLDPRDRRRLRPEITSEDHAAAEPIVRELSDARRRRLRSIYFDTPDLRLHRRGVSLRARRVDGAWIQCVKLGKAAKRGVSARTEVEHAVRRPEPDVAGLEDRGIRRKITKAAGDNPLVPVFETTVWRTSRAFTTPDGAQVELCCDRGEVTAGDATAPINEVELELKAGAPHALLTVAEALFADRALEFGAASKADCGAALVRGAPDAPAPDPSFGQKPTLQRGMRVAEALTAIGAAAGAQILDNWPVVLGSDAPEGPHQLRVGLRRLRSALRLLGRASGSANLSRLEAAARDLGRVVGELRDADVLADMIKTPQDGKPRDAESAKSAKVLVAALDAHRMAAKAEVRAALGGAAWTRFRLNCALFDLAIARAGSSPNDALDRKTRPAARAALGKAWKKVDRWGQRLDALTIPERHEMRKSLKTLRYGAEFFASLFPGEAAEAFVLRLKKLQNVFGYLNDVALMERLSEIAAEQGALTPATAAEIERLRVLHEARADAAWKKARKRWRALERAEKFWL